MFSVRDMYLKAAFVLLIICSIAFAIGYSATTAPTKWAAFRAEHPVRAVFFRNNVTPGSDYEHLTPHVGMDLSGLAFDVIEAPPRVSAEEVQP